MTLEDFLNLYEYVKRSEELKHNEKFMAVYQGLLHLKLFSKDNDKNGYNKLCDTLKELSGEEFLDIFSVVSNVEKLHSDSTLYGTNHANFIKFFSELSDTEKEKLSKDMTLIMHALVGQKEPHKPKKFIKNGFLKIGVIPVAFIGSVCGAVTGLFGGAYVAADAYLKRFES